MIRLAKTAVLAAVLVGLLAALGVSSASASRLCTSPGEKAECVKENIVPQGTAVKLSLIGKSKFEIGLAKVECSESILAGFTTSEGNPEEKPIGEVGVTFSNKFFTECSSCEVDVTLRPQWGGGFSGTGNIDGVLHIEDEFEFKCGAETCIYEGFEGSEGIFKGGESPIVEFKLMKLTRVQNSTNKCVQYPEWTAIYEVVSPAPLYVTEN